MRILAALIWAVAMPSITVHAEENSASLVTPMAQEIIVTSSRTPHNTGQNPYMIAQISQQELDRGLPRTIPEALGKLPGILVQKTAPGHGSPYIRGFTGNRTVLLVDGVRYNNATYRDGANEYFSQLDQFSIHDIELISGPSSALYGSEAVGGTLSLTSKSSDFAEENGHFITGEQTLRLSSADNSISSRSQLAFGEGQSWGFIGGVTLRDYGDVRAADLGRLPNTGYDEQAWNGRLDAQIAEHWTLTLNHSGLLQNDVPRTHSTIFSLPFAGTQAGTDLVRNKDHHRMMSYVKLTGQTSQPLITSLSMTLSHQFRTEDELRVHSDLRETEQSFVSNQFAMNLIASGQLGASDISYGMDLSSEWIDSARLDFDPESGLSTPALQGPVGDDARYQTAGIFGLISTPINDWLDVSFSLRASQIDAKIGIYADPETGAASSFANSWFDLSGSSRAILSFEDHRIWLAYSRSFRAPNIADISRFGRSRSAEIEVASPNLQPEKFDTYELGYRYLGSWLTLDATAYTTRFSNYIATLPTGKNREDLIEVAKQNAASGQVTGIEVDISANLSNGLSADANFTWLTGRLNYQAASGAVDEPISRIQPLTGNFTLAWEDADKWAELTLTLVDRADKLSAGDLDDRQRIPLGGTPGYALLNLRGGVDLTKTISTNLLFGNLLNQTYRAHGSGSNEAGRHIQLGIRVAF